MPVLNHHVLKLTELMQGNDAPALEAYLATIDAEMIQKLFVIVMPTFIDELERRTRQSQDKHIIEATRQVIARLRQACRAELTVH